MGERPGRWPGPGPDTKRATSPARSRRTASPPAANARLTVRYTAPPRMTRTTSVRPPLQSMSLSRVRRRSALSAVAGEPETPDTSPLTPDGFGSRRL